ncbi:MAG: hypothetical protein K2N17_06810, partial [Clostridia bacterium]|nr:hypothetical protein [Clostridia bacterium]
MGYIENNLAKDEKIMARIKHSWAGMVSEVIRFLVLLGLGIFIFFIKDIVEKISGVSLSSGIEGVLVTAVSYAVG